MASLSKNSKFTYILRAKYPSFIERRNKQEVKCTICNSFVLIRYKGAADIDKYINAEKHKKQNRLCTSTSKLDIVVSKQGNNKSGKIPSIL